MSTISAHSTQPVAAAKKRLRELDFLRGLAIVLVLFRHSDVHPYLTTMGWIGVDLFFVLSGYLVSGLLFREYLRTGSLRPGRFLIRRGFKIYPIYYLTYGLYLLPLISSGQVAAGGVASDLLFVQNYSTGWGYAYAASWSLAVEEHFYIGLALALYAGVKTGWLRSSLVVASTSRFTRLEYCIFTLFALCFVGRLVSNHPLDTNAAQNFTMTHLRLDSLLAGVLIAYLHHFKATALANAFQRWRRYLLPAAALAVLWTPFIAPMPSYFAKTVGFSLLAFSFSVLLAWLLLHPQINTRLDGMLGRKLVNAISKTGFCSYSIYVMHTLVNTVGHLIERQLEAAHYPLLFFVCSSSVSIGIGILLTYKVEHYFLALRNKHFPGR